MLRMGRNPKPDPTPETENAGENMPQQQPNTSPNNTAFNQPSTSFNPNPATATPSSPPPQMGGGSGVGRAVTETESLARDIKEGALSGFVGSGTTLSGELTFKAMLRVDGQLSGRVVSQDGTLIVSAGGQVDADVEVSIAQINGTINGDVIATKRLELGRVAKINGNIQTPALIVEQGAIFEGSCRMTHLQENADKSKAQTASTSTASAPSTSSPSGATSTAAPSSSSSPASPATPPAASSATDSPAKSADTAAEAKPNTGTLGKNY